MSEEKRLGIAWPVPAILLLLGLCGSKIQGPANQAEAVAVSAAHADFQSSVGEPAATVGEPSSSALATEETTVEKVTSLKPSVSQPASERPSLANETIVEASETADASPQTDVASKEQSDAEESDVPLAPIQASATVEVTPLVEMKEADVVVETELSMEPPRETEAEPFDNGGVSESFASAIESDAIELESTDSFTVPPPPTTESAASPNAEVDAVTADLPMIEAVTNDAIVAENAEESIAAAIPTVEDFTQVKADGLVAIDGNDDVPVNIDTDSLSKTQDPSAVSNVPGVSEVTSEKVTHTAPPSDAIVADPAGTEVEGGSVATDTVSKVTTADGTDVSKPSTAISSPPKAVAAGKSKGQPFLGVGIRNPENNLVTTLYPDSTARKLGIRLGDKLIEVNGVAVSDVKSLRAALSKYSVDDPTTVDVERDGVRLKLGPMPLGTRS